jgi:hypothetical protein
VTEWELGGRHAPEYVLRLLEYYIHAEKLELRAGTAQDKNNEEETSWQQNQ